MEREFLCVNKVMLHLHNPLTFHYELNEGRQQCGFHKPVCHYKLNLVLGCKAANKVWLLAFTEELTERYEKLICCCVPFVLRLGTALNEE